MTSNQIEAFLTFLRDCEQRYHMAEADEQEANAITNDILHALELSESLSWNVVEHLTRFTKTGGEPIAKRSETC